MIKANLSVHRVLDCTLALVDDLVQSSRKLGLFIKDCEARGLDWQDSFILLLCLFSLTKSARNHFLD